VQSLGGPAEVQLGGDRDERFQLAQFHSQTLPCEVMKPQEDVPVPVLPTIIRSGRTMH
jgi:hypothetical protein